MAQIIHHENLGFTADWVGKCPSHWLMSLLYYYRNKIFFYWYICWYKWIFTLLELIWPLKIKINVHLHKTCCPLLRNTVVVQLQNWNSILRLTHSRRLLCHISIFYFLLGEGRLCGDCIPCLFCCILKYEDWQLQERKGSRKKEQNINKKHMKRAGKKASACKAVIMRHWSLMTWLTWPLCNPCNQATQQFFVIKTAVCV